MEVVKDEEICKGCTRKCAQFMCCICEHKDACTCSKVNPTEEEG